MVAGEVFGMRMTPIWQIMMAFAFLGGLISLIWSIGFNAGYQKGWFQGHHDKRMRAVSGPSHPDRNPTSKQNP